MLRRAFKEWAVICRALAEGRQALILRKGGIAEEGGVFRPGHSRFWLFPTFVHQQADGIKPEAAGLLRAAEADRPPPGIVRLTHFAEVSGTYLIHGLETAQDLEPLHIWSAETVRKRFVYREPGLYVLPVRIYRVQDIQEVELTPEFDGCKTWVDLGGDFPEDGAEPVLDSRVYGDFLERLDAIVNPTARA
jgi:hypothetical protein